MTHCWPKVAKITAYTFINGQMLWYGMLADTAETVNAMPWAIWHALELSARALFTFLNFKKAT